MIMAFHHLSIAPPMHAGHAECVCILSLGCVALVTGLGSQGIGAALRARYARCLSRAVDALSQRTAGGLEEDATFSQQVRGWLAPPLPRYLMTCAMSPCHPVRSATFSNGD